MIIMKTIKDVKIHFTSTIDIQLIKIRFLINIEPKGNRIANTITNQKEHLTNRKDFKFHNTILFYYYHQYQWHCKNTYFIS